jgi:hypothetical protein
MSDRDDTPPGTPSAIIRALPITKEQLEELDRLQTDARHALESLAIVVGIPQIELDRILLKLRHVIAAAFLAGRPTVKR